MTSRLLSLVGVLPSLAVWIVAAVIAGVRWSKHPVVSALVATSAALHCLVAVAQMLVPMSMMEQGMSASELGIVMSGVGLVGLAASGCLIAAAFAGRQDTRAP